jgi:signal transduction histidine kinase
VRLADARGALEVEVLDDGPGFGGPAPAGRGLTGLRDRVESLGGVFDVSSTPGAGTLVRAMFPPEVC